MSWLDDMEAADPAYPDPGADPWAAPDYVPDTSSGLPAGVCNAIVEGARQEWARQQNARALEPGPEGPSADGPTDDPWASPSNVPGPAVQQSAGEAERAALGYQDPPPGLVAHVDCDAAGRWAQQHSAGRSFTLGEAYQAAEDAVGLFLEYRDTHGRPEADARIEALGEVVEGLHAWADADEALNRHRTVGPDWRALRAAEALARDAGLRASVPQPDGHASPEYRADAAAWGSGRGSGRTDRRWAERWG